MFKDFIDLKFFLYLLSLDEGCRKPSSLKCSVLGHVATEKHKKWLNLLRWEQLRDGFKYKETESVCKRCRSKLILFQYPKWPNQVFSIIDCREKMVSW